MCLWLLTLVMWVYMANYVWWFFTGRMEMEVLVWKGIVPVVDLALAIYWSFGYHKYLRRTLQEADEGRRK